MEFLGSNHWICTCSVKPGRVLVLDSLQLYSKLEQSTQHLISRIYTSSMDTLQISTLSVQQQEGYCDCALFAIANSVELCNGNDPEECHFNQLQLRHHLLQCLEAGKFSPFPMKSCEPLPRPQKAHYNLKLYCYCKMPETFDSSMINCDSCKNWFHFSCVGLRKKTVSDVETWFCKNCHC